MSQIDWSRGPNDPHGYQRMTDFLLRASAELGNLGLSEQAGKLEASTHWPSQSPTEFLGDAALAISEVLADGESFPPSLRASLESAVEAIRQGFRNIGTEPSF